MGAPVSDEAASELAGERGGIKMMVRVAVSACGNAVAEGYELDQRARIVGRMIAEHGCDLLTDGGQGAMEIVARWFCQTPREDFNTGVSIQD
jgi:predicted Rossmann-fold nucleotide-binding protein